MYWECKGVIRDLYKAQFWLLKSADHPDSPMHRILAIGEYYRYGGKCFTKDITKSIEWFEKAANRGNTSSACQSIAEMYIEGDDYPLGIGCKKAIHWEENMEPMSDTIMIKIGNLHRYDGLNY
jgi:TPR repeat protein